jgi:hypothetical protein
MVSAKTSNCQIAKKQQLSLILIFSALSQSTKWRSHFVLLNPLLGLFFNSQKFRHTFVNWYKNWFFESQPAADLQKTNLGVS